eukprot:scaffold15599_cov120-Skeletonema_menzelii.AAC.1
MKGGVVQRRRKEVWSSFRFQLGNTVINKTSGTIPVILSPVKFPNKAHELDALCLEIFGQDEALYRLLVANDEFVSRGKPFYSLLTTYDDRVIVGRF